MTYYIAIEPDTELPLLWDDIRVAQYIAFATVEADISECVEKNGKLYASFETLDVDARGYEFQAIDNFGAPCMHVVPEGEYGLPSEYVYITQTEFDAL